MEWYEKYSWILNLLSSLATEDEIEAQRRSWVYGQTKLSNPNITREQIDKICDAEKKKETK